MIVWRLEREEFLGQAFQGHGAARYPGRWNLLGQPAAYASESRSLAIIEVLAHVPDSVLRPMLRKIKYFHVPATIPDNLEMTVVTVANAGKIHENWNHTPAPDELQVFGGRWLNKKETPVLRVPSVIIPNESNFVINPRHPDFGKIKIGDPELFVFDARLVIKP
jgi:RES domain-containing protein